MTRACSTTLALTVAFAVFAQTPRGSIIFEANTSTGDYNFDSPYSRSALTSRPGDYILIQVRMHLDSPGSVIGLGGATYQPTLSNWHAEAGDDRPPFSYFPFQSPIGRLFPFNSVGQGTGSASGLLTSFNDPGNILRLAGANANNPTTNLAWGVISAQLTQQLGGTNFVGGTDVVVFRFGIHLSNTYDQPRAMVADIPIDYIQNHRQTWFTTFQGTQSLLVTLDQSDIFPVTINVIPAPAAAFCLLALVPRRRRFP